MSRPLPLLLLVLLVACGGEATGPESPAVIDDDAPKDGGRLVRRLEHDILSMNPALTSSATDLYVLQYLFTPLLRLDQNLQVVSGLAESWEVSPDGLVYRFRINPRATHSDGTPVRPRDVLFTIEQIVDPANEALAFSGAFDHYDPEKSRVLDEHTLEIVFRQPLATQLVKFTMLLVLPEHVYSKGDFKTGFNDQAVGSGPYRLVRRHGGREVVLERRSDYWEARPHIRTVVFKVIDDQAVAYNALRRGEIDETYVSADVWVRERNNPAVTKQIDFRRFYMRAYNYIAWNNRHPFLADKRVRRALSMSVPIEPLIRDVYHNTARPMTGPFTPEEWAFNPSVQAIRFNPLEATRLLNEAGWRDTNGDGLLDRNGKPFRLEMIILSGGVGAQFAQMLQAELAKIGIALEIDLTDGASGIDRVLAGNFQAAYLSWSLDPDPDPYALFHSTQFPPHGQNFIGYANAEVDRLLEQARRELDLEKRKQLYWRVHEILADDQPYTWVIQAASKWAVNRRVRGIEVSPGYGVFLWHPGELDWWIASAQ